MKKTLEIHGNVKAVTLIGGQRGEHSGDYTTVGGGVVLELRGLGGFPLDWLPSLVGTRVAVTFVVERKAESS